MRASTLLYQKYKIFGDGSQSTSGKGALIDNGEEGQNGPTTALCRRNIAKLPFAPDGQQRRQHDTHSKGS